MLLRRVLGVTALFLLSSECLVQAAAVFVQGVGSSARTTPVGLNQNAGATCFPPGTGCDGSSAQSVSIQYGWYNADLPSAPSLGNAIVGACLFGGSNLGASNLVGGMAGHGAELFGSDTNAYAYDGTNQQGIGAVYVGNLGNGGFGGRSQITSCAESSLENEGANPSTSNDGMVAEEVSGLGCPLTIDVENHLTATSFGSGTNNIQFPPMTTTANGDYVWAAVMRTDGSATLSPGTNVAWVSGVNASSALGAATEHFVQSSVGQIQPTFTGSAGTYIGVEIAFKAGGGCNANNTGFILQSRQLVDSQHLPDGSSIGIHPLNGNLFVIGINGKANQNPTVRDNKSNTYVGVTGPNISSGFANSNPEGGGDYAGFLYVANGTKGVSAITASFADAEHFTSAYIYDFLNAAASPFDAACGANGSQDTGPANISPCSVTTTGANEWLLGDLVQWYDCTESVASPWTFGPQDQNNATADRFAATAGSYGSTYSEKTCGSTPANTGIGPWGGVIAAFKGSGGGSPPPPPPPTPCDVNGDGQVNVADVQKEVNMDLQVIPCTNPSGQCTVIQVQRVVNAALGGACVAP